MIILKKLCDFTVFENVEFCSVICYCIEIFIVEIVACFKVVDDVFESVAAVVIVIDMCHAVVV